MMSEGGGGGWSDEGGQGVDDGCRSMGVVRVSDHPDPGAQLILREFVKLP